MKRTLRTPRDEARVIVRQRDGEIASDRNAFWMKASLVLMAVLLFVLAGTYSARADSGQAFPKILSLPNGIQPEGIATGRGTDFYVGSLANGSIYKGDLRTGAGAFLVPGVANRAITGLKVDRRTNYVFAAGALTGKAYVFDGNTGVQLAEYQLAQDSPTFVNDVVITRDAAYFTDSFQPVIYKLPLGPNGELPDQFETITLGRDYQFVPGGFNANGIDASPDGKVLVVVNSTTGELYSVNPQTGLASRIDLGGASLTAGDGILLEGETLYVVRNQLNEIVVIDLNPARTAGTVTGVITDTFFDVPTTLARLGKWLYAVDARFTTPPTPDTTYVVVQVNK